MAAGRNKRRHQRGSLRKIVGSYKITGDEDNRRITVSKDLDDEDFPNQLGTWLKVELVIPADEDEDPFLEMRPKGD